MPVPLPDQLRDYANDVTSQSVPVELALFALGEPLKPPVTQTVGREHQWAVGSALVRRNRGWLAAAAAAAAVVVVAGIAVWAPLRVGSAPSSPQTQPVELADALVWSRIPYDDDVFGNLIDLEMNSITRGGPGLVAVGQADDRASVWTSPDGLVWSRVPRNDLVFPRESAISSVTVGGPGLVAVGSAGGDAAVWTSRDGLVWSRAPHNPDVFEGVGWLEMSSVSVGGPGLVAVGLDGHVPQGSGETTVVWTSLDGISWVRVADPLASLEGMATVVAGGPRLVAVGSAVWTSPDGSSWSRVPDSALPDGGWMSDVVVGGPGFVAVGGVHEVAAVWTSVDGTAWSRVIHDEGVFGTPPAEHSRYRETGMAAVAVGGPGLVAVGWDADGAAVWTSPDGMSWTKVPNTDGVFAPEPIRPGLEIYDVTSTASGSLVAVGRHALRSDDSSGKNDSDVGIWIATPGE